MISRDDLFLAIDNETKEELVVLLYSAHQDEVSLLKNRMLLLENKILTLNENLTESIKRQLNIRGCNNVKSN